VEDQPADSGDLTTEPAGTGSAEPKRKQRRLPWRRAKTAAEVHPPSTEVAETPTAADEPAAADESAPRRPTGKARRTPRSAAEADPAEVEAEPAEVEAEAEPEPAAEPAGAGAVEPAAESQAEAEAEAEPEPVLVPHRPAGKRLLIAAAAASVVFIAAAAFGGAMLQPYLADRAAVDTKVTIARTATEAITTLWSYTPEDMATLPDRSSRFLAGEFASEYRRYIDAIVSTNEQAKVTNTTQVMGTAVESLTPTEATALVYTNSVSTSPVSKNVPSLRYLSYRLTMERDGADWLITGMNAVTKLDLTPQL
jgi:Mce-associated membrane protein